MDITLVILAAGMGSRFGGLKQIEPVGPTGEIIADYAVYDAIRIGFNKIVFVIRKENEEYFQKNIINKYQDKIKVSLVFQELDLIPDDVTLPKTRVKMLGTGHALLCAQKEVQDAFVTINADDFYGYTALKEAYDFLKNNENPHEFVSILYPAGATMSKNGKVKRGVCSLENGYLKENIESEITYENDKYVAQSLIKKEKFLIKEDIPVSMNLFGFKHEFFPYLEKEFNNFIHESITLDNEFLLPKVLEKGIKENIFKIKVIQTQSIWMGITYHEDLPEFKKNILNLINKGEYPKSLWK